MSLFSKNKIGLALSSGGAKGLAHIGVIKSLVKNNIPIDFIAGSSAGSLIGGLYAATKDIEKIEKIAKKLTYKDLIKIFYDPSLKSGLITGNKTIQFLEDNFGKYTIKKLKIPFKAIATDIISGKTIAINSGNLAKAIRASSSIPFLYQPIKYGKYYLIDGGTSCPMPVDIVKDMGADKIIAVNLEGYSFKKKIYKKFKKISVITTLKSTLNLMLHHLSRGNLEKADITITPEITNVPLTKFVNGEDLISIGEKATETIIDDIKKLTKKINIF